MKSPYRAKAKQISEYLKLQVLNADSLEEIFNLMTAVTNENVELFNTLKGTIISLFV